MTPDGKVSALAARMAAAVEGPLDVTVDQDALRPYAAALVQAEEALVKCRAMTDVLNGDGSWRVPFDANSIDAFSEVAAALAAIRSLENKA